MRRVDPLSLVDFLQNYFDRLPYLTLYINARQLSPGTANKPRAILIPSESLQSIHLLLNHGARTPKGLISPSPSHPGPPLADINVTQIEAQQKALAAKNKGGNSILKKPNGHKYQCVSSFAGSSENPDTDRSTGRVQIRG